MISILVITVFIYISVDAIPPREVNWPNDLCTPFPYPTPAPINIITNEAVLTPVPSALKIQVIMQDERQIVNTGHSLVVQDTYPNGTTGITGGFLKRFHKFDRIRIFWSQNSNESSGGSVNCDEGAPVQIHYNFRNPKYSTFNESLRHRDGLVTLIYPVRVEGNQPNSKFDAFCGILRQSRQAGCAVNISSGPLYLWAQTTPIFYHYYSYPGSYNDLDTGIEYDCATMIVIPEDKESRISEQQFQEFKNIQNDHGARYNNVLKTSERGRRPLIRGQSLYIDSVQGC